LTARLRSPLPWLGALLATYLLAPLVAFLVRLGDGVPAAPGLGSALLTSLLTASIATALIALLGIPLAYLLSRARGPLGHLATALVALPLALPPLMSGILLLYLVGPYTALGRLFAGQLTDTRAGIVIAQTFVAAPFLVIAARGAFAGVDPALEDMARSLGHRRLSRFARVALPVAWPGVQAGLLLAWLRAFGEFGATVILAYHPYSLPVFTFVQFNSTGLTSTTLPMGAALGAALIFLLAAQLHGRARRPRARLPQPVEPSPSVGASWRFSLRKSIGAFQLRLDDVTAGSRIVLLGPSGAGKTLTLRLLAGITDADHAQVLAGPTALHELPAEERRIGYLPQQSALLPRRTVWQQVTFAVDANPGLAAWWLDQLGLAGLQDRFPEELSGGQQRRVALARALARDPSLVLLDEPFSGLDVPVRRRLYRDLRRLQRQAGLSTVLVTHDPEEAALLSDEIIVLVDGQLRQHGANSEVFARPASPEVAELLGIPNVNAGRVLRRGCILSGGRELRAPTAELDVGSEVLWSVHPEDVAIESAAPYPATVLDSLDLGARRELLLALGDLELTARIGRDQPVAAGSEQRVQLPAEAIAVWPATAPAPISS